MPAAREGPGENERVGSYVVLDRLGEGATGEVYRAVRTGDDVEVALKLLRPVLAADAAYAARFRREARVAAEVQDRHLVPVLEFGEADGWIFLASEYWDGGSLDAMLTSDERLPLVDCVQLATEVAAGLQALHNAAIVHRDVKPSNVMLDREGRAAVTDFGLARGHAYTALTQPGQVLGTLDYIAPELIEGKEATALSDVYSLGCLVYECITGAPPFAGRGMLELAVAHLEDQPPDPRGRRDAVGEPLAWALLTALAKEPGDRPPSAIAYAQLLAAARSGV